MATTFGIIHTFKGGTAEQYGAVNQSSAPRRW